jgi:hypothetical protein
MDRLMGMTIGARINLQRFPSLKEHAAQTQRRPP